MKMIRICTIFFNIIILILPSQTFAQSINDSTNLQYHFNIEAQSFYQPNIKHIKNGGIYNVHHDVVSDIWGNPALPKYDYVLDNPFNHSAFYARLYSETSFKKHYFLLVDAVVEHRGMSLGINDLKSIVLYPIYRFDVNENYNILNDTLNIKFQLGCFTNNKIHQGLKVYNMDTQGFKLNFNWNNFNIQLQDMADLSFGVGLMLEEHHDISFGYNKLLNNKRILNLGVNSSYNSFSQLYNISTIYKVPKYFNYGVFGDYTFVEDLKVYFQYELRNSPYVNIVENSAIVVGTVISEEFSRINFSINPEFRYYGWVYNYGHKNDSVSYRFDENSKHDAAFYEKHSLPSVGRYLYPLMNYNNPFSQWAVYTDYQFQNIAGFELRATFNWMLSEKISFKFDIESCTLLKEFESKGSNYFTYLFYTNSIKYDLAKKFNVSIEVSNKAMNLDKHYQTFYMSKIPYLGFRLRKEL